jgi:Protein of unknown function (DUF4238)
VFPESAQPNDDLDLEALLSQMESRAAPIVARLRTGVVVLGDQERADLGYFITFTAARVPPFRDMFERSMSELAEDVLMMGASNRGYFKNAYREANRGRDFTDTTHPPRPWAGLCRELALPADRRTRRPTCPSDVKSPLTKPLPTG